jgi:flavodoxin
MNSLFTFKYSKSKLLSMKTLVVYYSRTGNTKMIAEAIAGSLNSDIEEIVDHENRSGIIGYIKSGYQTSRDKIPVIDDINHDLSKYDLVVVGTPVWAGKMSVPVKAFLKKNMDKIPLLACFCTCGRSGIEGTLNGMAEYTNITPLATMGINSAEIKNESYIPLVEKFVQDII